MSSGKYMNNPPPAPRGASCHICCKQGFPADGKPLVRNCGCHDAMTGHAHVSCLVNLARHKCQQALKQNPQALLVDFWAVCPICDSQYIGDVALSMANAYVDTYQHLPETDMRHFTALQNLATIRCDCGDLDGALSLYEHLQTVVEGMKPYCDVRFREAELLGGLAPVYIKKFQLGKAKECFEQKIKLLTSLHGPHHPDVQQELHMLEMFSPKTDTKKVVEREREILAQSREFYNDPRTKLACNLRLLLALQQDGQHQEALDLAQESFQESLELFGPDHPDTKRFEDALKDCKANYKPKSVRAIITGVTNQRDLNGRVVQVIRMTKDDKYVVLLDKTKFKAEAFNLIFDKGTPIVVQGLVSASHLNGSSGTIKSFDDTKKRYVVVVDKKAVLVKPKNLRVVFP